MHYPNLPYMNMYSTLPYSNPFYPALPPLPQFIILFHSLELALVRFMIFAEEAISAKALASILDTNHYQYVWFAINLKQSLEVFLTDV